MSITRRGFLTGISAGLAGLGAGAGYRKLVPFVVPPENITPGVATWYASTCRECPAGCGLLLRNREARVVKAEGNPLHPINSGRLCARGQASLQGLYDPDRLRVPRRRATAGQWEDTTWEAALAGVGAALTGARRVGFISDLQAGSLATLIRRWLTALRSTPADYLVYEPFNYEPLRAANQRVFGRAAIPDYRIDRCDYLISLGADFLETWISPVQFTRRFVEMRRPTGGRRVPFVYVGPRRSLTAAQADRHIQVPSGAEHLVARALLDPFDEALQALDGLPGADPAAVRRLATELASARAPLVLAGDPMPTGPEAEAAATAAALLTARGSGRARVVDFGRTHALGSTATVAELGAFLDRAAAGEFDVLVILMANPAYSLPSDLKSRLSSALAKVGTVVCLTSFDDETVAAAAEGPAVAWALPVAAPAESWGDYNAATGIHSLLQPAMGSYFHAREPGELLMQLARAAAVPLSAAFGADSYYDFLRNQWRAIQQASGDAGDFEEFWHRCVREGGLTLPVRPWPMALKPGVSVPPAPRPEGLRLHLYPSLHFFDGRHANRTWLQEAPDPMTRAVWGSWVELHPDTARELGVGTGDRVEVRCGEGVCVLPAHVWDGVAPGTAAIATGQGHAHYGRFATEVGANAFALLQSGRGSAEVRIRAVSGPGGHVLAHGEQNQHGRGIALGLALSELSRARPEAVDVPQPAGYQPERDVYEGHSHPNHRWAMAVDLDRCIGCNACVVACYAENNIAVVGKDEVRRRHELPWLRVDRYDEGAGPNTRVFFVPLMCQHCDAAPCEPVCPVFAAVHNAEGLNEQVYNRCVGTRYCSNNCPYKVRRFNWFRGEWPEPLNYQLNPDVTVRDRGVMEKCSFCVQRIKEVTIRARAEGRRVRDGEVVPACVQTCPADAFVFGDLNDPESRISRVVREDVRRYQILRELNTKPAVFYRKKILPEA